MRTFEPKPVNNQKSFYGKCEVLEKEGIILLRSYDTIVCMIKNNKFYRTWAGYSNTTKNHVNAFRNYYGFETINKKTWDSLEVASVDYDTFYAAN